MKKLMVLLLAAVLCLSLAACELDSEQYTEYSTLLGYLDAGNYEQAQKEFDALIQKVPAQPTTPGSTDDPYAAEKTAILGTWRCATEGFILTFNPDGTGTATLRSTEYDVTWKWDGELNCYVIAFFAENQLLCGVIEEKDALRYFVLSEEKVYHSDCYEEAVKIEYQKVYENCMNFFADYTQAEPGQEFSMDDGAWTVCYKSAYLKDGALHIKGYVTNNTEEEQWLSLHNLNVDAKVIYDGARTYSWYLDFCAPEQYLNEYGNARVAAGATVPIEAVIDKDFDQVHFLGICFTVGGGYRPDGSYTGEEPKAYWIDFSEYLN